MNMAKLLITLFAILLTSSVSDTKPVLKEANHKPFNYRDQETISVFEPGTLSTVLDNVQSSPPKPLLIARPTVAGTYPILIFLHGTCLENYFYSDILQHIASHGYIVVAPQLYSCLRWLIPILPISGPDELNFAAEVANWLISGLENVLPENITGDINKLAIAGHSRGGKMAFALALGYAKTPLTVTISALIGLDPVEGTENIVVDPKVLTYIPNSFNLSVPVAVIGSGLGNESKLLQHYI
ncbi:chlorophyllase type 0 [Jatropha curcas]|uniref:chlorophyllase type 0 n=1 Tax=Jatropha curcas TaxID=180498 RepID=UPI0018955376|nr:chlorophyllase type 0 [Jatropha curcas]